MYLAKKQDKLETFMSKKKKNPIELTLDCKVEIGGEESSKQNAKISHDIITYLVKVGGTKGSGDIQHWRDHGLAQQKVCITNGWMFSLIKDKLG